VTLALYTKYKRLTLWHRKLRHCALQYRYQLRWHCIHACCVTVGWYGSRSSVVQLQCQGLHPSAMFDRLPSNAAQHLRRAKTSHTPLWACAMAMLIVIGEHKQCCPLLADCNVQKRGDNSVRRSRGTVCGNTLYPTTQTSSPSW